MIVRAQKSDAETLYLTLLKSMKRGEIRFRTRTELKKTINNFLLLKEKGKIIACASLSFIQTNPKPLGELGCLWVDPRKRNKGLCITMISLIKQEAKLRNIKELFFISRSKNGDLTAINKGFIPIHPSILPRKRLKMFIKNKSKSVFYTNLI